MASKSKPNKGAVKKPSAKKAAVPAKKPSPAKKASTPAQKPSPVKKASPSAKKPVPAKKASPPAQKAATPAPKSSPAVKKIPVPAGKSAASTKAPAKPVAMPAQAAPAPSPAPKEPAPVLAPVFPSPAPPPRPAQKAAALPPPLTLSVQTSAGNASTGNNQPANLLIVITSGGWPVTDLNLDHFTLMQHFDVPGRMTSFSNNIVSFRNAGSGAYLLQTRPNGGAPWVGGHLLGQLLVSSPDDRQGQAAFKLIIR